MGFPKGASIPFAKFKLAAGFKPRPRVQLIGEVTERLKVHDWKSCVRLTPYRGFESLPLRQTVLGR